MKSFGFDASALTRSALAVGFIAASVVMVWVIERPASPDVHVSAPPVELGVVKQAWPVTIESTYQVAAWSVRILGVEQMASHHDGYSWSGSIPAAIGDELLVHAQAVESDLAPNHGLRLLIGAAPERVVWGSGNVTATAEFSK